jgi:hypothetical protein
MTDAPKTIFANKEFGSDDWDAGTFCTVDDGSVPYTRTDHSQALIAAAERRGMERAAGIAGGMALPIDGTPYSAGCHPVASAIRAAMEEKTP